MQSIEFTEKDYFDLLLIAKNKYTFRRYEDYLAPGPMVLWRHDVDYSLHRAIALAKMEAKEGLVSTFFVNIHSLFYSVMEPAVRDIVNEICNLNHDIAIHLDMSFYPNQETEDLPSILEQEAEIFRYLFGIIPRSFSFHNPEDGNWLSLVDDTIGGFLNAYSEGIKSKFKYASDSCGYWRHKSIRDTLLEDQSGYVNILTHPEWWTPDYLKPRQRILRCAEGRCNRSMDYYDKLLERLGRKNIG